MAGFFASSPEEKGDSPLTICSAGDGSCAKTKITTTLASTKARTFHRIRPLPVCTALHGLQLVFVDDLSVESLSSHELEVS
jgi:hypothetical protein